MADKENKAAKSGKKLSKGALIGIIAGAAVVVIALVICVALPLIFGSVATNKYNDKDYKGAYNAVGWAWYMNKADKETITLAYVEQLCEEGEFMKASKAMDCVGSSEKADELTKKYPLMGMNIQGAVVQYGTYNQDDDASNEEPVEWIVLKVEKGDNPRALLLAKNGLLKCEKHSRGESINTDYSLSNINESCQSFYTEIKMGTPEIATSVLLTTVSTEPSSKGVSSGEPFDTYVFVPSIEELKEYLVGTDLEQYLIANNAKGNPVSYWLRNAGESESLASIVTKKGEIIEGGSRSGTNYIRPMMWVSLG